MGFLPVLTGSDPYCLSGLPGNIRGWDSIQQLTTHSFALLLSTHLDFDGGIFISHFLATPP